jgi:hypothetical protein
MALMLCTPVLLLPMTTRLARAQAVPAAIWPTGDTGAPDQPLPGQQLGSSLTLNQNLSTINAENEAFDRYGLGVQAEGGGQTNFFGTQTGQVTAAYVALSASGAAIFRSNRSQFYVLYEPQYNIYPQYSDTNNFRQSVFTNFTHVVTPHLGMDWNVTGSRFLSLTQFLPQSLGIGGIGVVVPTLQSQLLQSSSWNTNAGTDLDFRYIQSVRTTWTGKLTGAYFLLVPAHPAVAHVPAERYATTGLDLRMNYQWTLRDTLGAALTPVYLLGLTPSGHTYAETLEATYQRQLNATTTVQGGAGPLFIQSTSTFFGHQNRASYALNASITRQVRQSQFSLGYQRAFVVSFLTQPATGNMVNLNAYVPLSHHWLASGTASYTHNSGSYAGTIYGGSGQISYLLGTKAQLYAQYSGTSQNLSIGLPHSYNFSQNKFGAGIRFNLGNPVTRGGVQ